ncbi:hypothetical protein H1W37_13600 [Stappia taiwanensis]|uniref:Uncharacterized protein n=1 Tax=Stappia taiwanensis TaxID=992267 RepID=A0A838XSH2_9HYPH|nr:hypothetical protein [Stappia taiwanensis]MBA4612697.1 hypothetical protein [Stappia taiwanensis]GGE88386.1 hypothetical protein GCM10007285_14840 [Stappia taiwanensis]
MNGVLLIGEPDSLMDALRAKLSGLPVAVHELGDHAPAGAPVGRPDGDRQGSAVAVLDAWDMSIAPIDRIIFGPVAIEHDLPRTADDIERLALAHETALLSFLMQLQAAGRLLARHRGGQIWVITPDQSARYLVPISTSPIDTMARRAAVKSFAREIRRMDVLVNCLEVQLEFDQVPADQWRTPRNRTNVYASRFRKSPATSVAGFLCGLLAQADLPMSGLVVPVGIGLTEQSI